MVEAPSVCASWLVTCRRWAGGPTASWWWHRRWRTDVATAAGRDCRERRIQGHRGPVAGRRADLGRDDRRGGRELLTGPGNELRVYEEYAAHPRFSEGPWHLLPYGPVGPSRRHRRSPVHAGERRSVSRLVARGGGRRDLLRGRSSRSYDGLDRVELTTRFLDHAAVRPAGPGQVPRRPYRAALPLSEVASAVVGRGFGLIDADTAAAPWTLDNPANTWFGIGTTARVDLVDATASASAPAPLAVAEIVVPDDTDPADVRDLVVALARRRRNRDHVNRRWLSVRPPQGRLQPARPPVRPRPTASNAVVERGRARRHVGSAARRPPQVLFVPPRKRWPRRVAAECGPARCRTPSRPWCCATVGAVAAAVVAGRLDQRDRGR